MATPPGTNVRGFLTDDEGELLSALACEAGNLGPVLEIGSWCGRSTIWLAQGAKFAGTVVLALDHHRGSEEHQPGEMFSMPTLSMVKVVLIPCASSVVTLLKLGLRIPSFRLWPAPNRHMPSCRTRSAWSLLTVAIALRPH